MTPNVLAARLRHLQRRLNAELEAFIAGVSTPRGFTASTERVQKGENVQPECTVALSDPMARVLAEQRAARDYLASDGPDRAGAQMALADWVAEEVLLREEPHV